MKSVLGLIALAFLFTGCGSTSYHLKVVDAQAGEIFLAVSGYDSVNVGDVFALYSMERSHNSNDGGGHHDHGGGGSSPALGVIGYVKVTEVFDKAHAKVELISGRADAQAKVERIGEKKHH